MEHALPIGPVKFQVEGKSHQGSKPVLSPFALVKMLARRPTDRKAALIQLRKHLLLFGGWCLAVRLAPAVLGALQSKAK